MCYWILQISLNSSSRKHSYLISSSRFKYFNVYYDEMSSSSYEREFNEFKFFLFYLWFRYFDIQFTCTTLLYFTYFSLYIISFILSIIMHILQLDNFCYFCVNITIELNSLAYTWLSYHVSIFNLIFNFYLTNWKIFFNLCSSLFSRK